MEGIAALKPSHWLDLIKLLVNVRAEWLREIDSTFQGNTLYWRRDVKHVPLFVRRLINKQLNDAHHHHHHSGCFSLPKEEPLSTCLPQLPVSRNVTPGRSNILD